MKVSLNPSREGDAFYAAAQSAFQSCVHCGFCNATCPTYVVLGDERDGPRGRIYAMQEMLETNAIPTALVPHLDRCLSCLACKTTCPSGVDYRRLIDLGRTEVARSRRWSTDGLVRRALAVLMTRPTLFRLAIVIARTMAHLPLTGRLGAATRIARQARPHRGPVDGTRVYPATGRKRARVALLTGCVQRAVAAEINEATVRLLCRMGCEVVTREDVRCCGSLDHHLGHEARAQAFATEAIAAWRTEQETNGLDFIVTNTSGCGAHLKDIGFHLQRAEGRGRDSTDLAGIVRDVSELVTELGLPERRIHQEIEVAYQSACTLRHGQGVVDLPQRLLSQVGFAVRDIKEDHLCCGSAGTYNILQPALADQLGKRKAHNITATGAGVVATGNVGCMLQLRGYVDMPVVHTVELLDWATGGPMPLALDARNARHA
jgi:glycolate oxidase iron-sulfur subunit